MCVCLSTFSKGGGARAPPVFDFSKGGGARARRRFLIFRKGAQGGRALARARRFFSSFSKKGGSAKRVGLRQQTVMSPTARGLDSHNSFGLVES